LGVIVLLKLTPFHCVQYYLDPKAEDSRYLRNRMPMVLESCEIWHDPISPSPTVSTRQAKYALSLAWRLTKVLPPAILFTSPDGR